MLSIVVMLLLTLVVLAWLCGILYCAFQLNDRLVQIACPFFIAIALALLAREIAAMIWWFRG